MADLAKLGRRSYVSVNGLENVLKELTVTGKASNEPEKATAR